MSRLLEFIKWNMTIAESEVFLSLVVEAHGQRCMPTSTPWKAIREFFQANVSAADTEKYLRELERRKKNGEDLLRTAARNSH